MLKLVKSVDVTLHAILIKILTVSFQIYTKMITS